METDFNELTGKISQLYNIPGIMDALQEKQIHPNKTNKQTT